MSRVLLTLAGVAVETFHLLDESAALPADDVDVLVPLPRLLAEGPALRARKGRLAVKLAPSDDAYALEEHLEGVTMVGVDFPSYQDGRGYTHARHLREQLSFTGEVRALGDIGIDHLFNLRRCGFDAFSLREGEDTARAIAALNRFSVVAQPASWSP